MPDDTFKEFVLDQLGALRKFFEWQRANLFSRKNYHFHHDRFRIFERGNVVERLASTNRTIAKNKNMIEDDKKFAPRRREKKLKTIGVAILILGIASAGILYWAETRAENLDDNPAMLGFDRNQTRQMEMLYGKEGALMDDLTNALKQPGTQAMLILIFSGIVASGFFYFARTPVEDDKAN